MSADTQMTDGKLWNTYLDVVQLARGLQSELTAAKAEVEALRAALQMIEHATAPTHDDDGYHENAYSLARAALVKEKAS